MLPLAVRHWRDAAPRAFATAFALLLAACGGGGSDGSPPESPSGGHDGAVPINIELDAPRVVEGTNRIALSWRAQGSPTSFTVFVQRVVGEAFVAVDDAVIGHDAAEFARGAAWRYDWPTARVRVRGCASPTRCAESNSHSLLEVFEAGVQALRPEPEPAASGLYSDFGLDHDGSRLWLSTEPISLFSRSSDGRWTQDDPDTAPARDGNRSALSGDGRTLAIGLPSHRGTVGGIGAPEDEPPPVPDGFTDSRGAVAIYVRDAGGAWQQQTFIKAEVPTDREYFGQQVALSSDGNRLAVSNQGGPDPGDTRVYLYQREGGSWRLAWRFTNRPLRRIQSGPLALSADGRTLAVRASGQINPDQESGLLSMVQIFRQCACQQGWELAGEVRSMRDTRTPLGSDDAYARALSLSADGKVLALGAPDDSGRAGDDGTGPNEESPRSGAVYVYAEGADRRWERRAFLKTANAPRQDHLGAHVQLRADGRALLASACGLDAGVAVLRRVHRADAQPPQAEECSGGANFYVFEADAQDRWTHTAAALVPNANTTYGLVRASADLETIAAQAVTVRQEPRALIVNTLIY